MKQRSLARNRWRRLGWLRFLLQLGSVALVYFLASVPSVLLFGQTNTGMLVSVVLITTNTPHASPAAAPQHAREETSESS